VPAPRGEQDWSRGDWVAGRREREVARTCGGERRGAAGPWRAGGGSRDVPVARPGRAPGGGASPGGAAGRARGGRACGDASACFRGRKACAWRWRAGAPAGRRRGAVWPRGQRCCECCERRPGGAGRKCLESLAPSVARAPRRRPPVPARGAGLQPRGGGASAARGRPRRCVAVRGGAKGGGVRQVRHSARPVPGRRAGRPAGRAVRRRRGGDVGPCRLRPGRAYVPPPGRPRRTRALVATRRAAARKPLVFAARLAVARDERDVRAREWQVFASYYNSLPKVAVFASRLALAGARDADEKASGYDSL